VQALKADDGTDLHVIGSPGHVQALIQHDLVDEFQLMIDPLIVGGGKAPVPVLVPVRRT
jgi:dihydrofolate reductase